ncbi:NADH dehydrogenase i, g subunit [Luminiphilus syltensis NOR5-1B]|uniref:NADH dehydrogenase i, g subunit n=1 Tax=Luminiphilus syltensis NOR5-1B TaxID=565045 RepID=B8KTH5_9GAMM|nr:NADH dehydrogenase i, g subunit [Luminiphilus syltensis NOR5-1B]
MDLPYFCWHPAMGSVGACRQCAVVQYQNEEDTRGRIVMGCMTPVTEGAIFSLTGDKASGFRQAVIESLMLNHPHDCAVCAEGGECHLQDMTVMVGHRDRRYRGLKKTHRNQYLGPLVHHEMNRCITCYRCTRYYRDYAGGTDLAAMASHDHVFFGRHDEGTLQSEFAGNLVEVCPTGVFTDKTLVGQYTRKWDLQSAPSVCVGCAVGCNTVPGERYGKVKRVHNRFNAEVNGYFLCDRGRYGSGYVNSDTRLPYPGMRGAEGRFTALNHHDALAEFERLTVGRRVAGIGSPRASVEANFLLRSLVGSDSFAPGVSEQEQPSLQRATALMRSTPARVPSLADIESADAILVLGDDVTHTAPRVALALRQSVRNRAYELAADMKLQPWQDAAIRNLAQEQRSPLVSVTPGSTRLDDVAERTLHLAPGEIAEFAFAVAAALSGGDSAGNPEAAAVAQMLRDARRPLIIAGTSLCEEALLDGAAAVAGALVSREADGTRAPMLSLVVPEANSLGQALLCGDDAPDLATLTARAEAGEIETLIVLENDLYRRGTGEEIDRLLDAVTTVIVLDGMDSATCSRADLVLPAASAIESEGTVVSMEGRAQRYYPVFVPGDERHSSLYWLLCCLKAADHKHFVDINHVDEVIAACASAVPALAGIVDAAPGGSYRSHGVRIPRQPHRYSGRTAMRANISVHEPKQPQDEESPLAYSMEGLNRDEPGSLLPFVWSPGWNSNQSLHKFQDEVGGALSGGTAGARLIEAAGPTTVPEAATPSSIDAATLELIPRPAIFGSDELSARSAGVRDLMPDAYLELSVADAKTLGVEAGDGVVLGGSDTAFEVRIDPSLRRGCVAYAPGLNGCIGLVPRSGVSLSMAPDWKRRDADLIARDGQEGSLS